MEKQDFANRTMHFGLRIIRLVESLSQSQTARVIGNQFLRAGTAVGANYRSASLSRSELISSPKWELWKKNATRLFTGCKC